MIRLVPVFRVLGALLIGVAILMAPPLALDGAEGAPTQAYFVTAMAATAFAGLTLLVLTGSPEPLALNRRQAFLITAAAWIVIPVFAGVPFLGVGLSPAGAYFEAASGLSTTGSTVITGLDAQPMGILLWRSMLNMIGGAGIVVLAIVIMPFLRVGGMQLFRTESSDNSDKLFSKGLDLARWITGVYFGLVTICAFVYAGLGMTAFDAINHAMTTIATGGFSTHDASFAHFKSPAIEWAAIIFMAMGGLPFVAYIRFLRGRRGALTGDAQLRAFFATLLISAAILTATRAAAGDVDIWSAFRAVLFNVTSVITTTGFATEDYQLWGEYAVAAFFVLTFVGGCSGSTAGGIKIYRLQILWSLALAHLSRIVRPSHVVVVTYSSRRVDENVALAILTFLIVVVASFAAFTLALSWTGMDFISASSSAATALMNVGPGLGPVVGPAGNFATIPESAKLIMSVAMILGRLEFFTLLVMLTPAFWRG